MNDLTIGELIRAKFSGELDQTQTYVNLALQAVGVMVAGFVLWRASNSLHRKKQQELRNRKFETNYSKHWRKH